jgi:signal transduction histidine kinase
MTTARERVADAVVAVGVAAVLVVVASAGQAGRAGPAAYLWAAALGALMFWRRRYARTVLVLTVVGMFAYYAAGFAAIGVAVPVAAALFAAAEAGHRRSAVAAAAVVLAVSVAFRLLDGQEFRYVVLYEATGHVALMAAAIALGELVNARRRIAALTGRQIAFEAGQRLADHKQALARDLHDSIGHRLTVAAIHTNVAREEVTRRPAAAAAALDHVADAVTHALADLRGTVRELRSDADLSAVVEGARAAGFEVRTRLDAVDLPPDVSATVHRLVQEAVTNALRHSSGRTIDVSVVRVDGALRVDVTDDGAAVAAAPGVGLSGLGERVVSLGGRFDAGPASGGWRVAASIPLAVRP